MTQVLKADIALAEQFLTLLDEEAEAFTFQTFADSPQAKAEDKERERKSQPKKYAHVFHGPLSRHAAALESLNRIGAGVFVTVNQTDLRGRKAENIQRVRAVFADTDGADLAPILNATPEANFIVESSPGNATLTGWWIICPWLSLRACNAGSLTGLALTPALRICPAF